MGADHAPQRLGRYRILDEIGRGGMATVYHAIQEGPHGFENHVALKLIHERLLEAHPRVVKMLVDEARVAARINHPNVLRILDLVEQESRVYMVMDFVDGISMRGVLDHARETRCPTQIAPVIEVLTAACEGIHAAHQLKGSDGALLNLVHRDMKPGNIMVSIDGQVKVGDFGIALFADRVADSTAQGQLKGTPAYMSPEQTLGGPLDARSDVFSMGLTLYTLATNKLAFRARKAMQIALKIARESMEPHAVELEGVAAGLGDVLRKACARDPDDRYQDAQQLGQALQAVYDNIEERQSISEMLIAAGWQAADVEDASDSEELLAESTEPETSSLPMEPIEGPEEHELTHTGGEDSAEIDTHTYIPTVTELVTDLDATPLSSPRTENTEPLLEGEGSASEEALTLGPKALEPTTAPVLTVPSALSTPPQVPRPPDPNAAVSPFPRTAAAAPRPFDPNVAAAAAGPLGSAPAHGQSARFVGQERDFRGRVVSKASEEQTRIGAAEKIGVATAATLLLLMVLALIGYLFFTVATPSEQAVATEEASSGEVLPGGVAISQGEGSGRIESEEYPEVSEESVTASTLSDPAEPAEQGIPSQAGAPGSAAETIQESEMTVIEPEAVVSEPEAVLIESEPAVRKPEAVARKPEAVLIESEPAASEPEAVVRRPKAAVSKPKAAVAKPEVTASKNGEEEPQAAAEPGMITVSSYPWSEVWIDGKRAGDIPLNEHSLPAGVHTIRLVFPTAGNRELIEKVEVRAGKHLKIVRKLDLSAP